MILVDWGTSSLRAYRLEGGHVRDRVEGPHGILAVHGQFADTLADVIGPWLDAGEDRVLMSGMIGSRQGWVEAPYLPCPAGIAEIAAALTPVPFDRATVRLVPGLRSQDPDGVPEVMRGEEMEVLGTGLQAGLVCLPGTHSKWVTVAEGRIAGFTTHMTGEVFGALRQHTILGRLMQDAPHDPTAFAAGMARAARPGGILHHLFGVRTLGLLGGLADTEAASYLSGLLIGHELGAVAPRQPVTLVGAAPLCARYAAALAALGCESRIAPPGAAAIGLARIGAAAWT